MSIKIAELTIRRIELERLNPHPRNPRKHPEPGTTEWEMMRKSLEHDYFDPIVWNERNGLLVSGHLRTKVLRESGFSAADCVVVDYDETTHLARMIAANRGAGEDDWKILDVLLAEVSDCGADISLAGFTQDDLEKELRIKTDDEGRPTLPTKIEVVVECQSESQQLHLLERFVKEGLKCRALTF